MLIYSINPTPVARLTQIGKFAVIPNVMKHQLGAVSSSGRTLQPDDVVTDFEKALRNSLKSVYGLGDEEMTGCFFHLRKNSVKHMKSKGCVPIK